MHVPYILDQFCIKLDSRPAFFAGRPVKKAGLGTRLGLIHNQTSAVGLHSELMGSQMRGQGPKIMCMGVEHTF